MRDVPYPDALSWHAAFPANGTRRPSPPSRLGKIRHRSRCLPPRAHDARGTRTRLRLALPSPLLDPIHLGSPPASTRRGLPVSGDVRPLQKIEPALGLPHQTSSRPYRSAPPGRTYAPPPRSLPHKPCTT